MHKNQIEKFSTSDDEKNYEKAFKKGLKKIPTLEERLIKNSQEF